MLSAPDEQIVEELHQLLLHADGVELDARLQAWMSDHLQQHGVQQTMCVIGALLPYCAIELSYHLEDSGARDEEGYPGEAIVCLPDDPEFRAIGNIVQSVFDNDSAAQAAADIGSAVEEFLFSDTDEIDGQEVFDRLHELLLAASDFVRSLRGEGSGQASVVYVED